MAPPFRGFPNRLGLPKVGGVSAVPGAAAPVVHGPQSPAPVQFETRPGNQRRGLVMKKWKAVSTLLVAIVAVAFGVHFWRLLSVEKRGDIGPPVRSREFIPPD